MKIKVEIEEGKNRTSMVFEGDQCRERVIQFLNALDLSPEPKATKNSKSLSSIPEPDEDLTLKERLKLFLKFEYPEQWFSSREAKKAYESAYGEEIPLSTVSTYLSRMYRSNFLERKGSRAEREYRVVEEPQKEEVDTEAVTREFGAT